jgi:hypothetical protein
MLYDLNMIYNELESPLGDLSYFQESPLGDLSGLFNNFIQTMHGGDGWG